MKDIIKNILREHGERIPRPPKGNLSDVGKTAQKYFIAAKLIAQNWDDVKFEKWADMADEDPWYRKQELQPMLKLLNLHPHSEEANEIFWLAFDNRDGLRDGTFTSYADLKERPLKTYAVSVTEQESVSSEHNFDVHIDAYDEGDAFAEVLGDEDGHYHWWDWENDAYNYNRDDYDSDMGDRDVHSIKEIGVADGTSRKGALGEIKEHIGASPVENDIISELEGLVENWSGCEEGLPIPCRYKNEVQSIIEKYKSKSLYEHVDNFTSHYDEPEIGEPVVNINPGCTHYESEGFIEDINDLPDEEGTTITYRVTNNGDTYKEGDTLTKTMDQLSPLVNEQYDRQINYPVVINEIYVHLMELFKKSLGDEKIKELVKTDVWNLHETEQYTKLFNINDAMQTKQIIQFMVDKGLPETYKEFLGENLPPIHNYEFSRTYEQNETAIYESSVSIEDTNYDSALCSADENWWEHDPEDEHVETTDTDYVGEEEWESVHVDGKEVWQVRNFKHFEGGKNDDRYDPNKKICQ